MSTTSNLAATVAWLGFGLAFILGALSSRTNFCTLGAVSDIVNMGDWNRMRMWLLAIAVAIIGAQSLHALGLIDLSKSFYPRPNFTWFSYITGGLLFGVGMTLASGCGSRTLVRIGGGNLKSVVVLAFLGISAYMSLKGLFAIWRVDFLDIWRIDFASHGIAAQDSGTLLAAMTGWGTSTSQKVVAGAIALVLLIFVFKNAEFRRNRDGLLGGLAFGLAVVASWYITAHIGFGENPDTLENVFFGTNSKQAESLTFIAPIAYSLELLMLWSDKSLMVTFGIATTIGMILGSLAYALIAGKFRWEGFTNIDDMRNHIIGAVLMGLGGVTAMGCTIGQGISGMSTLALGSLLALVSMIGGCAATVKYQYWRLMRE